MGTTFGELQLVMRGSYCENFTLYEARFNLRHFTVDARFSFRRFIGPIPSPTLFARGVCFMRPIKRCFVMLCDAYKTAFSMYAKERDHTVMYIPFKCLFQVCVAVHSALGPS